MQDVIIIGGSFAGMAAALQLARARKKVLVIDAGQPRNRFASHSYGFLGQDGVDPRIILATSRTQLEAYPTVTWRDTLVTGASGEKDNFQIATDGGEQHSARRLIFATGVADEMPDISGLAERWGRTVFVCPYCHGYELNEGEIGIIATGPMSLHQAQMLPEWGTVTLFTNGAVTPDDEQQSDLASRGVTIDHTKIARIEGDADVVLVNGNSIPFAGLFTTSICKPATPLAQQMGCALDETPIGFQLKRDDLKETAVPGVFACGDAAHVPHSVSLAVADGSLVGVMAHRSLF